MEFLGEEFLNARNHEVDTDLPQDIVTQTPVAVSRHVLRRAPSGKVQHICVVLGNAQNWLSAATLRSVQNFLLAFDARISAHVVCQFLVHLHP